MTGEQQSLFEEEPVEDRCPLHGKLADDGKCDVCLGRGIWELPVDANAAAVENESVDRHPPKVPPRGERKDELRRALETPISRAADPETSHEAGEKITASGKRAAQQKLVLEAVRRFPGNTSAELNKVAGFDDRYVCSRRLPELRTAGLIKNGSKTRCSVTGAMSLTWLPVTDDDN